MNQIDKILPSKEEVDELLGELATLPKGMDQRPEPIILVDSNQSVEVVSKILERIK